MRPRLVLSVCFCVLSTGCSFHHDLPLRDALRAISVGKPLADDAVFDFEAGAVLVTRWENATGVTECAGVLLDDGRCVRATKYQVRGEEGKLALMMYIRRDRTEWVIRVPSGATHDELRDRVAQAVSNLRHVGTGHDSADLLERAWKAKRKGRSTYRRVYDKRWFPMLEAREERVRFNGDSIEILIEERNDVSLVVWTLLGWASFLFTGASH